MHALTGEQASGQAGSQVLTDKMYRCNETTPPATPSRLDTETNLRKKKTRNSASVSPQVQTGLHYSALANHKTGTRNRRKI